MLTSRHLYLKKVTSSGILRKYNCFGWSGINLFGTYIKKLKIIFYKKIKIKTSHSKGGVATTLWVENVID